MRHFFKTTGLFVCLLSFFCLFGLNSCVSEFYSQDSDTDRLNNLKSRIYRFATEYGINVSVNDNLLKKHLDMTDENIEKVIRNLSTIPGTYLGKCDSNGKVSLNKAKKNIKRIPTWSPEAWNGTASAREDINSACEFNIELNFSYSETESCYVECTSATFHIKKDGKDGPYEEDIDAEVSNESFYFSGTYGFNYEAKISCTDEDIMGTWNITCVYDHGSITCLIY